jgi:UDP-GlcNAc3NAcA epimerase
MKQDIVEIIVHTGQHFDANMSGIFFKELNIPTPHYNLDINNSTHGDMTGRMLSGIEGILLKENPDQVLVYGDTNSTLAGALAAAKLHIPVVHVEAGLRSFNMKMPEEVNRILTDRVSRLLCCPTDAAVLNLKNEGFENFNCTVVKTGDVMEDAVRFYEGNLSENNLSVSIQEIVKRPFILCTIHREENTNDTNRLASLLSTLTELSKKVSIIFPLHPRTKSKIGTIPESPSLYFIDPVGYKENLYLQKKCKMVITDSGGMQKEAYFLKKHCITVRDETEWTELVIAGCNVLCGADKEKIITAYNRFNDAEWNFADNLYGGGKAAEAVYQAIQSIATH